MGEGVGTASTGGGGGGGVVSCVTGSEEAPDGGGGPSVSVCMTHGRLTRQSLIHENANSLPHTNIVHWYTTQ